LILNLIDHCCDCDLKQIQEIVFGIRDEFFILFIFNLTDGKLNFIADMPIARKASLRRFMEKRKDRYASLSNKLNSSFYSNRFTTKNSSACLCLFLIEMFKQSHNKSFFGWYQLIWILD